MCYGHQDNPCRGQASGDGIWGENITNAFLHLREEKQKQTNFVNSDYHLGSQNLLHEKMNSFVIMRFFFFLSQILGFSQPLLALKKINQQPRKSSTNSPLARGPTIKGCFVRLLDPHTRQAGRSPSRQGQGHHLSRQSHLGSEATQEVRSGQGQG